MSATPVVAVLGTGIMGSGMARSILRAGLPVRVWNRTAAKAEPLAADGATVTATAEEAVRGADIVLTMLNDTASVEAAMSAARAELHTDQVWLQSTTVGPDGTAVLARRAEEWGPVLLDAPVSGTRSPAEQGRLTVFVSGPESARAGVEPVLDAIGQRTLWVGKEPGAASRLKLVANTWVVNLVNSIAEALNLAEGIGVDPRAFLDAVSGGPLDTPYLHAKSEAVLSGDLTADFALSTALKDVDLIQAAANSAGVRLDLIAASAARFTRAAEAGHGDEDLIATYYAGRPEATQPEATQ
ncbi:NAD(P)-dependent oxidoreductase [Streptomyces tsukubensis]|uniref:3-hydroxyisobutyrate dehydrogenase n=1 Tax=Streptomyces tsukubensis TaxID=83656 RepID=A0A1V4A7H0_9ACTN|nr:NAD(P)-dependent oxidoreductase [Streptomyces tsukubensis]OON77285.1 3-hydroxyisobutyrate dehydrogenase [Streptomyces tsukubensis]QFR92360.1 NAD-binding protein [Streptomyces tsukubensis]